MPDSSRRPGMESATERASANPSTASFNTTELGALLACTSDHVFVVDAQAAVHKRSPGNTMPLPLTDPALSPTDREALQQALAACLHDGGTRDVAFDRELEDCRQHCRARLTPAGSDRALVAVDAGAASNVQEARLATRYAVERLFGHLSRAFINVAPSQIDAAVTTALEQTAGYCGADRAYLYQFSEDGRELSCQHVWRCHPDDGATALPDTLASADQRRLLDALEGGQPLRIPKSQSGSSVTPIWLRDQGVHTAILAPVAYSGTLQGFLGVDSLDPERSWAADDVHVTVRVSELLASALQRKSSERRILRLAYYDPLTGLPNRELVRNRLAERVATSSTPFALALVDLDDASTLNDVMGHAVGDHLLRAVGERLLGSVGDDQILARWGGDAFMLTLALSDDDDHDAVARRLAGIRQALSAPVPVGGQELRISACIGATCYPRHGGDIEELVRFAELALDRAKGSGRDSLSVFDAAMEHQAVYRARIEHRLRLALEEDNFSLHYQPQIGAASGQLTGLEGLIRWFDPVLGEVTPERFIQLAEDTGLIMPIGEWVIDRACRDLAAWRDQGLPVPVVAVNIAVQQLLDPNLPETLRRLLARHGIAPEALELEITESALMDRDTSAVACLEQIRALGVGVAVDDFGTGYSSLSQIKQLPVNKLKIDRSFIHDILTDANDHAIVLAIIAMAHQLGLPVVAEGVETSEQLARLQQHGCDVVQGYLYGRPEPAAAVLNHGMADPAFAPRE